MPINVKELTEEIMNLEKRRDEALEKERFDNAARQLFDVYESFKKAGFSEIQAWELTRAMYADTIKKY